MNRSQAHSAERFARLHLERLESREVPTATASLAGGILMVDGGPGRARLNIELDAAAAQIVVVDTTGEVARFAANNVTQINVVVGDKGSVVKVSKDVTTPTVVVGGDGKDSLRGGSGPTTLIGNGGFNKLRAGNGDTLLNGGPQRDFLRAGNGNDTINGGAGVNKILNVGLLDFVNPQPGDLVKPNTEGVAQNAFVQAALQIEPATVISAAEVQQLLARASAVTPSQDGIIAVVDRNGRILGVRVEAGVNPALLADPVTRAFAIDGAVAKARTGAFFGNNQAPLTSRVIQNISQTTMTQRVIESRPVGPNGIPDPQSTDYGPGFVAPVGIGGHFPPGIAQTPQVDLFAIEHTNRDNSYKVDANGNVVQLPQRFNLDPNFVPPGKELFAPDSYGTVTGTVAQGQGRGIATLPGGIPLYKNGVLVGGIGVFYPGATGYATEENSNLSTTYDPLKPDRALEAEYVAVVAAGGAPGIGLPVGPVGGIDPLPGFFIPVTPDTNRIELVGVSLNIIGPEGTQGPFKLIQFGLNLGTGTPSGTDLPVNTNGDLYLDGRVAPSGWLVTPHDGVGVNAQQVEQIIMQGIAQAAKTRAAIRLPLDRFTRMVFAVSDLRGNIVGLFRMPDSTIFSIDVAVAKARNVAYYANEAELQPEDLLPGLQAGIAFSNRTFRYLANPRFPIGIDGTNPAPFSILLDGGTDPLTGLQVGPRQPGTAFRSVQGFDAFNPGTNFRDPFDTFNQNGIVFFPGGVPLYSDPLGTGFGVLIGGFGVSGDGVDQDDVVTFSGSVGFGVPANKLRVDQFTYANGIRLPYQKFNRQPLN